MNNFTQRRFENCRWTKTENKSNKKIALDVFSFAYSTKINAAYSHILNSPIMKDWSVRLCAFPRLGAINRHAAAKACRRKSHQIIMTKHFPSPFHQRQKRKFPGTSLFVTLHNIYTGKHAALLYRHCRDGWRWWPRETRRGPYMSLSIPHDSWTISATRSTFYAIQNAKFLPTNKLDLNIAFLCRTGNQNMKLKAKVFILGNFLATSLALETFFAWQTSKNPHSKPAVSCFSH